MRRGPYTKVAQRNAALLERIRALKADHPFWGYRRMWAYLRYVDGLVVNQKRIYGVMKAADLVGHVEATRQLRCRRVIFIPAKLAWCSCVGTLECVQARV